MSEPAGQDFGEKEALTVLDNLDKALHPSQAEQIHLEADLVLLRLVSPPVRLAYQRLELRVGFLHS